MKAKCYDCRDICTKNYYTIDVISEDGNKMAVTIHAECHTRALYGGKPIYPERVEPIIKSEDTQ